MRHFKTLTLWLLLGANLCYGQNKPVVISAQMLSTKDEAVSLGQLDGWYFRPGSDTTWAKTDINMAGWQKLRPLDLSAKYAGKNGKVECWFRIKLKLGDTLKQKGFAIDYGNYAPADIYVNGKRIGSKGNTGLYGHPYSEYQFGPLERAIPINVKRGEQFTLALHLVDSLSPLPPRKLKSQVGLGSLIIFLGSSNSPTVYMTDYLAVIKSYVLYLIVCLSLSLIFWPLVIKNRRQKVFLYLALWTTTATLNYFFYLQQLDLKGIACLPYLIYKTLETVTVVLIFVAIPVIICEVFKRRLVPWVKIVLAIIFICGSLSTFLPWLNTPSTVGLLFLIGLSGYYFIFSWKTLRGAQWSVVAGLLTTIFFLLLAIVLGLLFPGKIDFDSGIGHFIRICEHLSFPLSLLVFVAMRFNEMLREVKQNADEVVRLSEEKREEALNRQKILEQEVNKQTAEIKETLEHLKSTQTQLIQREKMASLGELTAGIAHEIQNPLNFVNNFSEVNQEMLDELDEELNKGDIAEAKAIAADIRQNEQKINHHGKRADSIVKGMLEHSRTGSGQKEPTDINVMADEFMRLSYHGLRSKDKSFNAEMTAHFDPQLPKVNVSQQDMGRVMLNLFNNAFYAVNQKQKTAGADYKPEVSVITATEDGQIVIKVKDNGVGIPDAIKEKIMQPFFTTKPTGEGTGLGLSLTYDMVVKGHGGSIKAESVEGEGSEFTILLPVG